MKSVINLSCNYKIIATIPSKARDATVRDPILTRNGLLERVFKQVR